MFYLLLYAACSSGLDFGSDVDGDGYTLSTGDCDDSDPSVNPGVLEYCADSIDNNCDGQINEDGAVGALPWYADLDGDGFGGAADPILSCTGEGLFENPDDCDDSDPLISPAAIEVCNTIDDDCDGLIDSEDPNIEYTEEEIWYLDYDGDGYGEAASWINDCSQRERYVSNADDCDDTNDSINPGMPERCDTFGVDDNCDNLIDDPSAEDSVEWFKDMDADGFGDSDDSQNSCFEVDDHVLLFDDCDDTDPLIFPNSHEVENLSTGDVDCNGRIGCMDLGCNSAEDVLLPVHLSTDFMAYASQHLEFNDPESFDQNSLLTSAHLVQISAPLSDGYRRVLVGRTELLDLCEGSLELYKITESGLVFETDLTPSGQVASQWVSDAVFADVNNDGVSDVVAVHGSPPMASEFLLCENNETEAHVFLMNDTGSSYVQADFHELSDDASKVLVEDLNDDGNKDVVLCRYWDQESSSPHQSSKILWGPDAETSTNLVFEGCSDLVTNDWNSDGYLDLAVASADESENAGIFWGPDFDERTELDVNAATSVQTADFDQDGNEDLLFGLMDINGTWNRDLPIFWGNGSDEFNEQTQVDSLGCMFPLADDLDQDGDLDLICPNYAGTMDGNSPDLSGVLSYSPPSYVYWGAEGFRWPIVGSNELIAMKVLYPSGALHALPGDFDENGERDLIITAWQSDAGPKTKVYWSNPSDSFGESESIAIGPVYSPPISTILE